MKKTYQKPAIETFRLAPSNLMAATISTGDDYAGDLSGAETKRSFFDEDDDDLTESWYTKPTE